jgi:colanic acid biosynthesis glycosyl transferase WcaI
MASRSHNIIFVNRYFYPDHSATSELLSDLAFDLSRRRFNIAVITSRLRYDDTENLLPPHEVIHGVEVWRVSTSRRGRDQLMGRFLDYTSFYLAAGWRLWRLTRPGYVIVAKTDPPLLSVLAACIALLRGAKLINWQQDIFPEVAEALQLGGDLGRLGFALLRLPRNWSLRRASANVAVGRRMAKTLQGFGIPPEIIRIITNWGDGQFITPIKPSENPLRAEWGLMNDFVVCYAGNLGRAHETQAVLGAMEALNERSPNLPAKPVITFLFVGGGALRGRLEEEARKRNLTNVQFRGYQPREQLSATLGTADVHLVSLNPLLEGLIVPSKIYAIAAAGRPAIFIGNTSGEVAEILDEIGCGFTVAPHDVSGLVHRILEFAGSPQLGRIMGARARAAFEQQWDKAIAIQNWETLLRQIIDSDGSP